MQRQLANRAKPQVSAGEGIHVGPVRLEPTYAGQLVRRVADRLGE